MSEQASGSWSDLRTRIVTGLALAVIGLGALVIGAGVLALVVAILAGMMIWELARIVAPEADPERSYLLAAMATVGILACASVSLELGVAILAAVPVVGAFLKGRSAGAIFFLYACLILAGALGVYLMRTRLGLGPVLWLAAIVVGTDIAGYFGGRMLGGPKFWPSISPKKTWAGTLSGWVAAALIAAAFAVFGAPGQLPLGAFMLLSVVLSFAAQMGDIGESALKRRVGVKDSSNLLPGHGGVLDRFDGMIAVFAVMLVLWMLLLIFGGSA